MLIMICFGDPLNRKKKNHTYYTYICHYLSYLNNKLRFYFIRYKLFKICTFSPIRAIKNEIVFLKTNPRLHKYE